MQTTIVNLRQFYSSPLGKKLRRRLRRLVRRSWSEVEGLHMVGIGYTTDLLPLPGAQKTSRIVALMPELQGAIYWPINDTNHSVLADTLRPPFMVGSIHRVLIAHAFEHTPAPEELLQVWWQLLAPGGRMLLIVPNRHGLWRFGSNPFATGKPYTLSQLRQLLNDASFTVRDVRSAFYAPPSAHPLWLYLFSLLEWVGSFTCPRMGGVLVIEAEKQIYAGVRTASNSVVPKAAWAGQPAMSKNA